MYYVFNPKWRELTTVGTGCQVQGFWTHHTIDYKDWRGRGVRDENGSPSSHLVRPKLLDDI